MFKEQRPVDAERLADIARELNIRADRDQEMRRSGTWDFEVDADNREWLKKIVSEIGWPTIPKVGVVAAGSAWLIAQHADLDIEFQERALNLMRASKEGEIMPRHLAYLEDRVRVARGEKQIYGTQPVPMTDGVWRPHPIENEAEVDMRRASVGLEPLAEYVASCNRTFGVAKPKGE